MGVTESCCLKIIAPLKQPALPFRATRNLHALLFEQKMMLHVAGWLQSSGTAHNIFGKGAGVGAVGIDAQFKQPAFSAPRTVKKDSLESVTPTNSGFATPLARRDDELNAIRQ